MSARASVERRCWAWQPMSMDDLDEVLALEQGAYAFPWSRGHFVDSLATKDWAVVVRDEVRDVVRDVVRDEVRDKVQDEGRHDARALATPGRLQGYLVAMLGVEEMHLLNVTVRADMRRQGLASWLMQNLLKQCRAQKAATLWLEVRPSNHEARALYAHLGFEARGLRKGYYPDARGRREDAIVMALAVPASEGADAAQ
jgi:[ribosomal protein S18]-alanine N-acetyltransferase